MYKFELGTSEFWANSPGCCEERSKQYKTILDQYTVDLFAHLYNKLLSVK